jgi:Ni2+-binding GTPase involved in maturation of urease and hydrogenase
MDLHIVGGFLGSGKTTAIIGAAKQLMAQGQQVGVVTNDQGRYLVDTAFFHAAAVPAVEVTGGCFCCNYADLDQQLAQLQDTAKPDVIFAESVGSCADIVATVVKPLLALRPADAARPTSFSVFADARLLRRRLLDLPMPFSDDVVYLFDKQIEEAGLLVINKCDLLSDDNARETAKLAEARFGGKPVRLQNSLDENMVTGWLTALASGLAVPPTTTLEIDYDRYGAGEAMLAWLDEQVTFTVEEGTGKQVVARFLSAVLRRLEQGEHAVGHLKVFISTGAGQSTKLSFPTLQVGGWERQIPMLQGTHVEILVNARVEMGAEELNRLIQAALAETAAEGVEGYQAANLAAFHPSYPTPTHRFA